MKVSVQILIIINIINDDLKLTILNRILLNIFFLQKNRNNKNLIIKCFEYNYISIQKPFLLSLL